MNKAAIFRYGQWMRAAATAVFLLCMAVQLGWAWGREGHRLTALVAEQYLSPEAKAQIAQLLGSDTFVNIAPWADEYRRDHPETGPWHYVDIPSTEKSYDRMRDCPAPKADPQSPWRDCVTDRIRYFEGRLSDASLSPADRAMALKFVVHLIGDIHQPFHALGDARGGNGIAVSFFGSTSCGSYTCNLHGIWDDSMILHEGLSETAYTQRLLKEIQDNKWERLAGGEPGAWANISHEYAVRAMVPNGALITPEYENEEIKVVDSQLALGGLRLARVLNHIFETAPAASAPQSTPAGALVPLETK